MFLVLTFAQSSSFLNPATASAQTNEDNLASTMPPDCSISLQAQVNAAPVGATLTVEPCIYRETVSITKPLTLVGGPRTEIRGSDVWTDWSQAGVYWVKGPVPEFSIFRELSRCAPETGGRCLHPEQVFFDGRSLQRVDGNPRSGQFALDSARSVILADDPRSHTVEVTVRTRWIVTGADNVTIDGFTMRHAANDAQTGAIANDGQSGWTLQNSVLSDAHGAVVSVAKGSGNRLLRNDISRAGQLGVHMTDGEGAIIQGNRIHDNNVDGFESHWEAGGLKATLQTNLLLDGNEVDHNHGPGLWCDIHCHEVTFSNNRVHHNASAGIYFEISSGARIFGNAVWENGQNHPVWGYGAGIMVANSANAEVFDNVVAWNARGIVVLAQQRNDALPEGTVNNSVQDNVILQTESPQEPYTRFFLGWMHDYPSEMFEPSSNNHGQNNAYWAPTAEGPFIRFEWKGSYRTLSDFGGTPGDRGGRYLSDAEKDGALAAARIPATPESL